MTTTTKTTVPTTTTKKTTITKATLKTCVHSHPPIAMTTTTKTTVPTTTTKKTTITKAALKKITAEKRRVGKAASKAAGKKNALAMKKAGKGIFAPKKLSDALAAICGKKTAPRTEVTKLIW